MRAAWFWGTWLLGSVALGWYYLEPLVSDGDQRKFLIGELSHGHHQIELACHACHTSPFGGGEVLQRACIDCHGAELKAVDDSHPKSKFTNPRNADRVATLDARYCVSCHTEHHPEITRSMGVTLPEDFCFACHENIAQDSPSHEGMAFDTCASAGCHNFHDNKALYENFLLEHAHDAWLKPDAGLPERNNWDRWLASVDAAGSLARDNADAPDAARLGSELPAWHEARHAEAGVNCSDCHGADSQWQAKPALDVCASCHGEQWQDFVSGKHGMRLAQNLPPMTVAQARIPMHDGAAHRELTCNSCHDPHALNLAEAATEACQGCHASEHTNNFALSPHAMLPEGQALSCASCHMPRENRGSANAPRIVVNHNQNANLRPSEKMVRDVCLHCHGLGFSLNALADPELIRSNFQGRPTNHVPSIDMALERERLLAPTDGAYR